MNSYFNILKNKKSIILKLFAKNKNWLIILLIAYGISDLILISIRPLFLSGKAYYSPLSNGFQNNKSIAKYNSIWDFNIFHNGEIPPSLSSLKKIETTDNIPATLSHLPLQLNGTIVYRNAIYSMANVTLKNKNTSESYQVNDTIDSIAYITNITATKMFFINLNSKKEEFIEVPHLHNINFAFQKNIPIVPKVITDNKGIKKIGDFKFQVSRSNMNKNIRQLSNILQDAKMVPHWQNGKMIGFRFKYIKKGSIYEKFDFKVSDIIVSVSGERPRSQLHAAELFHQFRSRSHLDMIVKRKGKDIAFSLDVTEDVSIEEPPSSRFY